MPFISTARLLAALASLVLTTVAFAAPEKPPEAAYVEAEIDAFIEKQRTLQRELKDGVGRLQAICKKRPTTLLPGAADEQSGVTARLQENRRRLAAAEKIADSATSAYADEARKRKSDSCNSLLNFLGLDDKRDTSQKRSCESSTIELKTASQLRERFIEYQDMARARSDLFKEMLTLEARGCARAGFTARVLSVYEPNNLDTEAGVGEHFTRLIERSRQAFRPASGDGK